MIVKFNSVRLLGFQDRLIRPGINDLPEEMVAAMMEDSVLIGKFDSGELEIVSKEDLGVRKVRSSKKGEEPSAVDLLLASADGAAEAAVEKTVDLDILKGWLAKEKRVKVRKAIKKQVKRIEAIEFRDENSKGKKFEKAPKDDDADDSSDDQE